MTFNTDVKLVLILWKKMNTKGLNTASRVNITKINKNIFAKLKSETNVLTLKLLNK